MKIYHSKDYAGIEIDKFVFHYGFEEPDPTGEWCFVVRRREPGKFNKEGHEYFRKTSSELSVVAESEDPKDMLLAGVTLWLNKIL